MPLLNFEARLVLNVKEGAAATYAPSLSAITFMYFALCTFSPGESRWTAAAVSETSRISRPFLMAVKLTIMIASPALNETHTFVIGIAFFTLHDAGAFRVLGF